MVSAILTFWRVFVIINLCFHLFDPITQRLILQFVTTTSFCFHYRSGKDWCQFLHFLCNCNWFGNWFWLPAVLDREEVFILKYDGLIVYRSKLSCTLLSRSIETSTSARHSLFKFSRMWITLLIIFTVPSTRDRMGAKAQ